MKKKKIVCRPDAKLRTCEEECGRKRESEAKHGDQDLLVGPCGRVQEEARPENDRERNDGCQDRAGGRGDGVWADRECDAVRIDGDDVLFAERVVMLLLNDSPDDEHHEKKDRPDAVCQDREPGEGGNGALRARGRESPCHIVAEMGQKKTKTKTKSEKRKKKKKTL